jgi:hypothetical protein
MWNFQVSHASTILLNGRLGRREKLWPQEAIFSWTPCIEANQNFGVILGQASVGPPFHSVRQVRIFRERCRNLRALGTRAIMLS